MDVTTAACGMNGRLDRAAVAQDEQCPDTWGASSPVCSPQPQSLAEVLCVDAALGR